MESYLKSEHYQVYSKDALLVLKSIPKQSVQLIVTSPPYNIGKAYEKAKPLEDYIKEQEEIISQCYGVLKNTGSICWQVGNYVYKGEVFPLDIYFYQIFKSLEMQLRNRVIWHFNHGLHCKKRLSGRYETILWFSKSDDYNFNLDPIRIPQKYTNKKYFKGKKKGQLSCNPLGKNPSDVWGISNVKHNHPEKTEHPCQYPLELCDRLILSLSDSADIVLDPYLGSGTTLISALRNNRRFIGSEINKNYMRIIYKRLEKHLSSNKEGALSSNLYNLNQNF